MNIDKIQKNKTKTILQFSIPSIIAMLLTSLITITDGFFIGNYVGKEGLAAVNLGLPIVYLFLAVGLMISVGGMSMAGMAHGDGNIKKCNNIFNQTISTVVFTTLMLGIIMSFFFNPLLHLLKADVQIVSFFKDYYTIMLLQLPIMVLNTSFGMFIVGEGKPQYFMLINVLNVLANVLLDYLFVRWFHLGVRGVAIASLVSTLFSFSYIIYFFIKKSSVYKLGKFIFSSDALKKTLLNGSSEFIGEMSLSLSMFAYNFVILKNIGIDGVSAFSIVGYILFIFSMITIGFGQGVSPLISFTYGAKEYLLATNLRKITNTFVFTVGAILLLLVFLSAPWYSNVFVKSAAVANLVHSGVAICSISFLFSGLNTISSFYFTAIGKAKESAIISSARGLVILLICIFTLPVLIGMVGVWLVAPITEALTLILSMLFIYKDNKKIRNKLPNQTYSC